MLTYAAVRYDTAVQLYGITDLDTMVLIVLCGFGPKCVLYTSDNSNLFR